MLGYTIGLRTLRTAMAAMDLIGQNVANASTPGYSRRLAHLSPTDPLMRGRLGLGTGVTMDSILRVHDDLLETRLRDQHQVLGRLDASGSLLQQIEGFFQEPSDSGLAARLDEMWNGFSELTKSTGDASFRDGLVQSAQTLSAGFRQVAAQVASVGDEARRSVTSAVDEVNGLTKELAAVNSRILNARTFDSPAGDLQDEQGRLLLQISDWIDPQTVQRADGTVDVLMDGMLLVSGDRANQLEVRQPGDGSVTVRLADTKETVTPDGGRLRGLLDLAQQNVPARLEDLNRIAHNLILQVNRLHTTGVSGLGPYTSLSAAVAVGERNGGSGAIDRRLADLDLPFPVQDGRLVVNVIDSATGSVAQHFVDIDPQRMSLNDLTAALDALPHVNASLDSAGRLRITAEAGFGFDFSARLDVDPDDGGSFGSGTATITTGAGPFALAAGDTLTLDVDGSGPQTVTFQAADFADITHATADEVAQVLRAQVTGLTADVSDGRLVLKSGVAGSAGSLQVVASSNASLLAAGGLETGSDQPVSVVLSGAPPAGTSGHYTVHALGDGTIGLTPGLKVEVLDQQGVRVATFDVGSGYTPGDKLEILPGVQMTLTAGDIQQSNGDNFEVDLVDDSDTTDVLVGLELGAFFTGSSAADIAVEKTIDGDPRLMAGSRTGDPSDGSNFFALVALKDTPLQELGGRTIAQGYGDLVSDVGLDVRTNQTASDAQSLLLSSLEAKREEISGVNQDEEMLHLLDYQHLYQAAGRYLQSLQAVQDTLYTVL